MHRQMTVSEDTISEILDQRDELRERVRITRAWARSRIEHTKSATEKRTLLAVLRMLESGE